MDIFVTNVPNQTNHNEVRIFLKDVLKRFDVLAYDVTKKPKFNWAIITLPDESKGLRFLQIFGTGYRGQKVLDTILFQGVQLGFRQSNKRGQPEALKVQALIEAERKIRSKLQNHVPGSTTTARSQHIFPFLSLMTGIWKYDLLQRLVFDSKYKDTRSGTVTFGKSELVLYLRAAIHAETNWHCRIDIPYGILDHIILSGGRNANSMISLTLKAPPKIYQLLSTEDLHLYTGVQAQDAANGMPDLQNLLKLGTRQKRLRRLCALQPSHDKASALCMVYRVSLPTPTLAQQAWSYLKRNSAVSERDCFTTAVPSTETYTIEVDFMEFRNKLRTFRNYLQRSGKVVSFDLAFQLEALVLEGTIAPRRMTDLLPYVQALVTKYSSDATATSFRRLRYEIPTPGPGIEQSELSKATLIRQLTGYIEDSQDATAISGDILAKQTAHNHLASTYKALVTPTGIVLQGPHLGVSNRVLRKYSAHTEHFMRVFFADEDGLSVFYDPRADQGDVYARFRSVLQEGILVADRKYEFLGFSNSSLHYHTAWFMAPFLHESRMIRARDVIGELGDFTHLHCAAKCAARIGQAFSDTMFAVPLPKTVYVREDVPDVERNGRTFSDGCGTISKDLLKRVWKTLPPHRQMQRPTLLQVRYKGAKGMVSLDPTLMGEQLLIRKSMTKYNAREIWRDLEICGAGYRPLVLYLNHQFVKILEDLGVPQNNFLSVLDDEIKALEQVIKDPVNAANFLDQSRSGLSAKIPTLFVLLNDIGLSFQADRVLTDMVEIAAMQRLRDLKYRARIPIEDGLLLYGIMDEFNTLKEGEVYVTTRTQDSNGRVEAFVLVQDRVVVTRAPALHPGDLQVVKAVNVPKDCPLRSLYNCVVFSQQGTRDLPSQLGGGDLDGDLFNVIYDSRLIPPHTYAAADYPAAPAKDLGRPVERDDIIDFFIEYMHSDRLGQISIMHKVKADVVEYGTRHADCIALSEMASLAVDFGKSGNPVNMDTAPKGAYHIRPDFMATGPGLVLKDKGFELEEAEVLDIDDPDGISLLDPDRARIRHYRSNKILGVLYRTIDETKFFKQMEHGFQVTRGSMGQASLMQTLARYIDRETRGVLWEHHRDFAEEIREYYETNMLDIMNSLRPHRGEPLKELEVFSGNILGKKERASTRAVREANLEVQERFNRDVSSIVRRIVHGDGLGDEEDEALPRALACFKISLEREGWENSVRLQTFKYVAAATCLERLWMYMNFRLRPL